MKRFLVFLWCSLCAGGAAAQDVPLFVPTPLDSPSATFVNTLLSDETLPEVGLRLRVETYEQQPGTPINEDARNALSLVSLDALGRSEAPDDTRAALSALINASRGKSGRDLAALRNSAWGDIGLLAVAEMGLVPFAHWVATPTSLVVNADTDPGALRDAAIAALTPALRDAAGARVEFLDVGREEDTVNDFLGRRTDLSAAEVVLDPVHLAASEPQGPRFASALGPQVVYDGVAPRGGMLVLPEAILDEMTARQQRALENAALRASNAAETVGLEGREDLIASLNDAGIELRAGAEVWDGLGIRGGQLRAPDQFAETLGVSVEAAAALAPPLPGALFADPPPSPPLPPPPPAPHDAGTDRALTNGLFFFTTRNSEDDSDIRFAFGTSFEGVRDVHCGGLGYESDPNRPLGESFTGQIALDPNGILAGPSDCVAALLSFAGQTDLTFLIHGFNTDFGEALDLAARLRDDLEIDGTVVLVSWASRGQPTRYWRDIEAIDHAGSLLAPVLRELNARTRDQPRKVSMIAHSLGGRLGADLMTLIAATDARTLENAVFVAAETPHDDFTPVHAGAADRSKVWTIYANAHDRVLLWARRVSGWEDKIGIGGDDRFVTGGVDTLDVSALDNDWCVLGILRNARCRNHTHAFDVQRVVDDLRSLLATPSSATERSGVSPVSGGGEVYFELDP